MSADLQDGWKLETIGPVSVEIPADWDMVTLNDVSDNSGQYGANESAQEFDKKEFRYIRITDISENGLLKNGDKQSIPIEGNEKYRLDEGDLLFARTGSVGRSYLYSEGDSDVPCAFAGYLIRYKINENIDTEYLKQYTNSRYFDKWVNSIARSTTHANINASEYSGLDIPYPPLPEQRRIANILSIVDEQIQLTNKLIDETRELKKGLSNDLFLNGVGHGKYKNIQLGPKQFEIPQEWQIKQISEVCDDIIDYRGKTPSYSDSGIPHIRNFNIEENRLVMNDIDYVSEETYDEWMTRGIPQEGDIFFTTEAPLGKAAMVPDFQFSLAQRLVVLQPGDEIIGEWLMYLLTSEFMKKYYHTRATGSTVKGLSNRALQKVKMFIPPIEEQSKITNCLSNVDAKLYEELEYKEELQNLKRGLMQDLLTGKVRVNTD